MQPHSPPMPGAVSRMAAPSTRSRRPAIYPPVGASPPPGFLMREPTTRSAPTWVEMCIRDRDMELTRKLAARLREEAAMAEAGGAEGQD